MARYSPTSLTECRSTTWALRRLADRGVRITIDDLGTGYCSFNSLRRMPVYALKIDRQFVAELSAPKTFQSGFAIVSAIVSPAIFVFDVIAEGVETQAQLDFSIGSAVLAQGDHLGRSGGIVAVRAVPRRRRSRDASDRPGIRYRRSGKNSNRRASYPERPASPAAPSVAAAERMPKGRLRSAGNESPDPPMMESWLSGRKRRS
jgi:EAL domain-containing protein (putative c-di-GMP-specific phosphodiesterase class I)